MNELAARITTWLDEGERIREALAHEGQAIVHRLAVEGRFSLRQLAARAELSATYLSLVSTGQQVISVGAYLKLAKIEQGEQDEGKTP